MTRIQLRIYTDPPQVEVFLNLKQPNGEEYRVAAVVDTGAQITLLPARLMNFVEYRIVEQGSVTVEQAGIARQSFSATEAMVRLFLEDTTGARTSEIETHVWFANTGAILLGFQDVLDQAALFVDMRANIGWIERD